MTTDGGSVWARGPGDDGGEPATPPQGAPPADEPASGADGSDEDTVWSRGPSIDETLRAARRPRRATPEPVLPPPVPIVVPARRVSSVRRPGAPLALAAVVVVTAAIVWMLGVVGDDEVTPAVAGASSAPSVPVVIAPAPSAGVPVPTASTTSPATSATPTQATSTTSSSTTSSTTTSTTTTSTTSTSSTSTSSTSTTVVPVAAAAVVEIVGRLAPCTFGSDCLVADFSIANFEAPQREFVCEFGSGERYRFRFDGVSAEAACATSAPDGSITIEVGGVRSETITR